MSENEAILKLMVPFGNKQNVPTEYAYPLIKSEGKYAIARKITDNIAGTNEANHTFGNMNVLVSKIDSTKFNNLYQYTYAGSNCIGMIAQLNGWSGLYNNPQGNSHGLLYQDNYEDKPEIRVHTYYIGSGYNTDYYSKNGDAITDYWWRFNQYGSNRVNFKNQNHIITYKISTDRSYYGMWPVMNIAS